MNHLVGKPIIMSIVEQGLCYTIVDGEFTVEITNYERDHYDMIIAPTAVSNSVIVDSLIFDSLIEALINADEIIGELLGEQEAK